MAQSGSSISSAVFSVPRFQAPNGGFQSSEEGKDGTLEETTQALFLSSLFGTKGKLDTDKIKDFLSKLSTNGAYSNIPGGSADVESVLNALLAYTHLNALPDSASDVLPFIENLYESTSKLYRGAPGNSPDFKSTAIVLQIYELLKVENPNAAEIYSGLTNASTVNDDNVSQFSSITSDNYYAILTASLLSFPLTKEEYSSYFEKRQVASGADRGAFYVDDTQKEISPESCFHSVHALFLLNNKKPVGQSFNFKTLFGYLNSLPGTIGNAYYSFSAIARTPALDDSTFKFVPTLTVQDIRFPVKDEIIVQGSLFRPSVSVTSTFGLPHADAKVSVYIDHMVESDEKDFVFNAEKQIYEIPEYWFDTHDLFGEVSFAFSVNWDVPGLDRELQFDFIEAASIGYDMSVMASALYNGYQMDEETSVGFGTTFTFDVKLGTVELPKPDLVSGDFVIELSIIDSSGVEFHTMEFDAVSNTEPISFTYELETSSLPAGRLSFEFAILNEDGVHTQQTVWFNLDVPMVATEISIEKEQTMMFGQQLEFTFEPATLSPDGEIQKYLPGTRVFTCQIFSVGGVELGSFKAKPVKDETDVARYSFVIDIPTRFDYLGLNTLQIKYQDKYETEIPLQNWDTAEERLFNRDESLNFQIDFVLDVENIEGAPTPGDLEYGDEITFSFEVKERWSQVSMKPGVEESTVFMGLRHTEKDGKDTFQSSVVKTKPTRTGYEIAWTVDPNAVRDAGTLELYAKDADGNTYPLTFEQNPWGVDVNIGGQLKIEESTFSGEYNEFQQAFFVSFTLTCQEKPLGGADLTAVVSNNGNVLLTDLPVTSAEGSYQVSWTLNTKDVTSGEYIVDMYRNVDLARSKSENVYQHSTPFFSVSHQHEGKISSPLPFKTEFVVLLFLVCVVVSVMVHKSQVDRPPARR